VEGDRCWYGDILEA